MIPTPEQIEYFSRLEPIPPHFKGTGALPRRPDARDYPALWHPGYRAIEEAGAAQDTDWSDKVCSLTDQGSTGACVVHSTCSGIQVNEEISQKTCYRFNPGAFYTELGGTGSNGIDSRVCLQKCLDTGAPLANSSQRVRIGSYFSIDSNAGTFVDSVKTALTAGKSVVMALLLPSTFGGKWVPGNPTSGYHQVDLCGTKDRLFFGPNSWGPGFGGGAHPPGFYELSFDYVMQDNFQHSYCYAYFFDSVAVGPPPPPPPPPVHTRATVTGSATGQVDTLMRGTVYSLGSCNVTLSEIDFDLGPPPPPPPPSQLSVTGYSPNPVPAGASFLIQGQGFQGGNLSVLWQERLLSANRLSDAQIQATAPSVTSTARGAVTVRVEGATANGPALTVSAGDEPTPGDLKVTVTARRYTRGVVGIWAYVQAPGNADLNLQFPPGVEDLILPPVVGNRAATGYVSATVTGTVNGADIGPPQQQPTATGVPATWQIRNVPPSSTIIITAVDDQGRRGQGTASV